MKTIRTLSVLIFLSCALAACAYPGGASLQAPPVVDSNRAYTLGSGDIVRVTVYGDESLTGEHTVDPRGNITVPMIGEVPAVNATQIQLQDEIAYRLIKGGFMSKPLVTVDIVNMRPFYILGEVKTPGSYPYQPGLDVFKAVATAGGYTPRAATGSVLIDRGSGHERHRLNATEGTPVLPGDSITVRERIF